MTHDLDTPDAPHPAPDAPAPIPSPLAARWSAARADYLAGATAQEACDRHGLSLRTFRWRAKKHGWRRADQWPSDPSAPFVARPDPYRPLPPCTYKVMNADGSMREVSRETFERICAEDAARGFDPDAWEETGQDAIGAPTYDLGAAPRVPAGAGAARHPRGRAGLPEGYGGGDPGFDWSPPAPPPVRDADAEPLPAVALRRQVYARMEAAIASGRLYEARGWTRLLINLDGLAPPPSPVQDEAMAELRADEDKARAERRAEDHKSSMDLIRCATLIAQASTAVAEARNAAAASAAAAEPGWD